MLVERIVEKHVDVPREVTVEKIVAVEKPYAVPTYRDRLIEVVVEVMKEVRVDRGVTR